MLPFMAAVGSPGGRALVRDVTVLPPLVALWITSWCVLSAAAWIAGGKPSASPLDFINPARIAAQLRADGGSIVWWHLVGAFGRVQPIAFWLSASAFASLIVATALLATRRGWMSSPRGGLSPLRASAGLSTTSRWATLADLRALRKRRSGAAFTLGRRGTRVIATEAETSVLVIGPTRSGKTSAVLVPNLFEWPGPAIATSTKSELVDITAAHRQSVGPVYVYDPTGELETRYQTLRWSPLHGCDDLDRAWMVASWLCAGLQHASQRSDNDWAHWAESGKLLIAPLLFAAARSQRTIVDVRAWIHAFDTGTPMGLIDELSSTSSPHSEDAERAATMLQAIEQRPERERGTVFSTVTRIFNVFNERAVADSALSNQLDADDFLRQRGTLYLCTPRQSPERIASLFIGLLMSIVTAAYAVADQHQAAGFGELGLFLDELANVVPIEDLPALASQGAGRRVLLMSIVQDLSQLKSRYGQDRAYSIVNNHTCKVILPGISDPETNDVVSRIIGRAEFIDVAVNHGGDGRVGRTYSTRRDAMAAPDALRQLRRDSAVVVYKGHPPAMIRLHPWYRDRRQRRLGARTFLRNADFAQRPG